MTKIATPQIAASFPFFSDCYAMDFLSCCKLVRDKKPCALYIKTCLKVLPHPQLNDLFTCIAKLARCWQAGQGDHYHIPPPSPCCKLFPAQMKYLFACKIVRNFPSRDQHRSSSSAPQYRGEMGSWQTCKGCLKMFRFRMKSLYSSIPLLQPSLTNTS